MARPVPRLMPVLALALVLALSGCATLANTFEDEPKNKIYVGVRQDFTGWTFAHGGFVDWPFSLVLDTILLPYTIPVTIRRRGRKARAKRQETAADGAAEGAALSGRDHPAA